MSILTDELLDPLIFFFPLYSDLIISIKFCNGKKTGVEVLQIRRGNRDNLGIISHFLHKTVFCYQPLIRTVSVRWF